jgi:Pectate lyase superfamily protein
VDERTLTSIIRRLNALERNQVQVRQGFITGESAIELGSSGADVGATFSGDFTSSRVAALTSGNNPPLVLPSRSWFSARDCGATGDGTTDDSVAIQDAIDAAALEKGSVFIPPGTYIVEELAMKSGVTVCGPGAILRQKANSTGAVDFADTVENATLAEVTIDGNSPNIAGSASAVQVRGTRNTVRNCRIYDAKTNGVHVTAGASHITVDDCHVYKVNASTAAVEYGIALHGATANEHCIVNSCHVSDTTKSALAVDGVAHYCTFSNNICESPGEDGIAAYSADNRGLVFIGNNISSPGNNGIHAGGDDLVLIGNRADDVTNRGFIISGEIATVNQACDRFTMNGNVVNGTTNFSAFAVFNYSNGVVSGNVAEGSGQHGFDIAGSLGNSEITLADNIAKDSTTHGFLFANVARGVVKGNQAVDNGSRGISITGTSGSSVPILVNGNLSAGNTTSQTRVQDSASAVFEGNALAGTAPFSNSTSGTVNIGRNDSDAATSVAAAASLTLPLAARS